MGYIVAVIKDGKTCVEIDGIYFNENQLQSQAEFMLWKHDPDGNLGYKSHVLEIKQTVKKAKTYYAL